MAALDDLTMQRMDRTVEALMRHAQIKAAYLFGSRADGRADEWSDYDVAAFIEGAQSWDLMGLIRFCACVQKEAGNDIELHVFSASDAADPEPASFAAYVLKHGIKLRLPDRAA